ncbi:PP2C family protein-serine/threonine phosphatase, partial [Streptomyces spiralis]
MFGSTRGTTAGLSRRRWVGALVAAVLTAVCLGATGQSSTAAAYPGPGTVSGDTGVHDPSMVGPRVALAAGDTTGRLVDAAAAMGELRAAVSALSELDLPPDEILARLHDLTSRFARAPRGPDSEESPDQTWPATCVYAVYDPVTRSCSMAAAGHPPPALVMPDDDVELIDITPGPPLARASASTPSPNAPCPWAAPSPSTTPDGAGAARPRHIPPDELRRVVAAHSSLR